MRSRLKAPPPARRDGATRTQEGPMNEKSYGKILAEGFVRAIPWAVMFTLSVLTVFEVMTTVLRQEMKEAIEFTSNYAVRNAVRATLRDPVVREELVPRMKQAVKDTIDFAVNTERAYPHEALEVRLVGKK
jgi:hypothetical protein